MLEQMGTQMLLERMLHDSFMVCVFLRLIVYVCTVVTLRRLYKHIFIPAKAHNREGCYLPVSLFHNFSCTLLLVMVKLASLLSSALCILLFLLFFGLFSLWSHLNYCLNCPHDFLWCLKVLVRFFCNCKLPVNVQKYRYNKCRARTEGSVRIHT